MKIPVWFWIAMGVWALFGIPAFILGQGFRGHFSILPDPPPFLWATSITDQTLGTLIWALVVLLVYMPAFAIPALLLWRRRQFRNDDAQN